MACESKDQQMFVVNQINPSEAFELLKKDDNSILVDVRTHEEFDSIGIANSEEFSNRMILLPWQLMPEMEINEDFTEILEEEIEKLFGDDAKDVKIIFMCRSGARSYQAANQVLDAGYQNCFNLTSGFEGDFNEASERGKVNGWKAEALPWGQNK